MNKRIEELARKANMVEVEYSPGFPDIKYPKNLKKFAELLIEAVMVEVRDEVQYEYDWTLADIVTDRVKKQFGV